MNITAVVLTKNEEANIKRCVSALRWCDELIVIDDYSDDRTVDIAKKLGAKIYRRELKDDFSLQRNFGLEKAHSKWVLFVDADEVVTKELTDEIKQAIEAPGMKGYSVRRRNLWLGKRINHGEMATVRLVRLGMRGSGSWKRRVHEYWDINGRVGNLSNSIEHYPHPTVTDLLDNVARYFEIHSQENYKEGKRSNLFKIVFMPIGKFLDNYFLKLGFLDGIHGLILSVIMSFHSFLSWSQLWFIQKRLKV